MNTREFAKKKVPCGRLNFYDQCRLRLNVLLDLDLPETILGCQHNYTAYEPILFSTMRIVKGHLTLKDGIFHAIADNLTLEVHHHEHLETLASFPKPEVEVQFVSTNPQDPNRIRPLFIPVDSYRMWDSHYDPYADIRARHYTCEFIFWSHSVGMIDLDMFLNALQQFHSARERFAGFAVPPRFIKSPTSPIFGGLSGRFRLPNLTFTLNRGNISGQIAPDEAFLDRYIEIRWERLSKSISVDATFPLILTLNSNRDSRLDAHLTSFRLSPLSDNGGMSCELGDLTAEISISLLEHLKDVKFPTLTKKVMREIVSSEKAPSPKTPERLAVVFDRKKRDFSVNSVRLEIKSSHRITASVDRIGIEMRMNSFSSVCYFCSVESAGVAFNSPLVSATQLRITYVSTSNYQIALADIEQLSVDFRQEDIEVIRLLTFNLKENVFSLLPVRKHEPHVRDVLMTVKIATGLTTLHIGDPFLELRFAELDIKMNNEPDQQRRFSIQLVKAEVTNWREKDLYRKMLEKLDNAPHLFVCEIIQAPPVFKIPVLKKVKVTVQAVIAIRIPQKADLVEPVRSLLTPLLELVDRVKTSVIDESKERSGEVQDSPEVRKSSAAQLFCQAIELRIGMVKLWKKPLPVCMEFGPPVIAKQDVYGSWKSLGVKALGWVMQGALKISPKS
jgi:hypothetical protein